MITIKMITKVSHKQGTYYQVIIPQPDTLYESSKMIVEACKPIAERT